MMAGHPPNWDPTSYGASGLKADEGRIQIGSLEGFQTADPNNLAHGHVYPSHTGHPGNQFDLHGQFPEGSAQDHGRYYGNLHGFGGANTNGGGIHGHGQFEHPYEGPFNVDTGYEPGFSNREVHSQFITEQPSRTHSHTPSAFSSQPWQGPQIQQFQSGFDLNPVNYGHRNGEPTYQQHVSSYQGNNFFNQEVFSARNGPTGFRSQPQPVLQSYPGHQPGGATIMQFQPDPSAGVQETSGQIYARHQQMQGIVPTPKAHPAPAPATVAANSVQAAPVVGPTLSNELVVATEPDNSWVNPDGCPFLLVRNPPPTKTGRYCDVNLRNTDKPYIAKHDPRTFTLLPQRESRLPCEIQAELDILKEEHAKALQPKKDKLQNRITELENEPVIVSGSKDLIPGAQVKVKASSKRQASNMDPASKPKSLENVPEDEESATDTAARTIKSTPRPSNALKAIEYDIINILWRDPKHPEFPQKLVGEKVHAFGDYVIDLWSKSKDLRSKVDDAKKEDDQDKAKSLKADLDTTYDSIRVAIEAAIMFGDRFTVTQLGIHTKFLGNLSIILRTLFIAEDYNGRLPKAILKLLSLFVTVEIEFLKERVKLDRVRQKFKDNLDEESTDYMDQIFDNAKKRSALKAEETREDVKKSDDARKASQGPKKSSSMSTKDPVIAPSNASLSKSDAVSKKNSADIKRPVDYSNLGSARKVSSTATKASPSLTASKRPGDDGVDSRVPKKLAVENAAGAPSSAKTSNATPAVPQSSSANAQSRSRPSGSMLPGRSRLSTKAQPKKPVPRQSASSTIGGLLAEINSEEKPKQAKEPERAPETPEETEIRLRKEARRKLHVTWKPDSELTEIRILEHDTAEDKGRDDNMLRDARDNRSEGQVLRESVQREKEGVDEAEEDEAREKANDIALRKWSEPAPYSSVQESRISQKRQEEMFASRGGLRPVESKQNKVMEEYESRELMAIYTSFSEIPETPRSPTGRIAETVTQPKIRTLPSGPTQWHESLPATNTKHAEIHRRWSDNIHFGPEAARVNALHRARGSPSSTDSTNVARSRSGWDASSGRDDASEVLALLQSDKVKNYVDPDPFDPAHPKTHRRHDYGDPKVQADIDALEDTFAMFISKQAPPSQPAMPQASVGQQYQQLAQPQYVQAQQVQPQPQQQLPPEYLEALQKINALSAGQTLPPSIQPPVAPSPQPNPVAQQPFLAALLQQSGPPPQPAQPANPLQGLQGILDALKVASAPAYTTPHAAPNVVPNAASYAAPQGYWPDWSQGQAQPQIQPQTSQAYTGYGHNNQSFGGQSQHNQPQATQSQHDSNDRGNRRDFRGNREQKNINRSLIGTKPCSFWAKGQCAKGSNCTFRHDPNDLQNQGPN
ncbi:hypothetical protein F5Y00DRAFT_117303 [Daldinia vernicosa]|uniref:uncharacterized protein n=1 Tax=Daldinia vernicosa TaxID=114800 RepID=UPI0020073B2E|nr:uncharacterized protein F5Y00DRAFT_117303 [Daldinia vernicosa]KAI0847377.1 hypothetical protein F5Y00DRAFT_117303 [Daldinia vernicosa]